MDPKLEPIHRELCDEIHADVGARVAAGRPARGYATGLMPGVAQLPRLTSTIENVLRSLVDFAATNLGPMIEAEASAYKDRIRQAIGEPTLEMLAEVIRRLEDAKPQAGT